MVNLLVFAALLLLVQLSAVAQVTSPHIVDLATIPTDTGVLQRVHGSVGGGFLGVPVAGGVDCDGDLLPDVAMASILASPLQRPGAGEVYLVFGTGAIAGTLDTAGMTAGILKIVGAGPSETAGNEIWMDDVTGDHVGDLLIGRQNFSPSSDRIGTGALTIVVGGPELRMHAATLQPLDLHAPPAALTLTTIVGPEALGRLGIWMRTGDVTGDGIADIVVGADQESNAGETHSGAVYVIRGGAHLAVHQTIDLVHVGTTPLAEQVARISPPPGSVHHHFGATCQIADLDGNGRGEVLIAAALARAGASIRASGAPPGSAHGFGGAPHGKLYIVWDDNFSPGVWPGDQPNDFRFTVTALSGSLSVIQGGMSNHRFGEEILGGLDYNNDGAAEVFVGDLQGNSSSNPNRSFSGSGYVFYTAASLRGQTFAVDDPPAGLRLSTFIGAEAGDIAADTAVHGDFDSDGIADLAFSAPHGSPPGRREAGLFYLVYGQDAVWPAMINLQPMSLPPPDTVRMTLVYGAKGNDRDDAGDVLGYSAAAGDIDGDGRVDLIANEMLGNGLTPAAVDTGNLIVVSGGLLSGQVTE